MQRNRYWAYPESILPGMASDTDLNIRRKAAEQICECRQKAGEWAGEQVRPYGLPKVNFDADHSTKHISWDDEPSTHTITQASILSLQQMTEKHIRFGLEPHFK